LVCPVLNLAGLCCRQRANRRRGGEQEVPEPSNVINFRRPKPASAPMFNLPTVVWAIVALIIAIHAGLELGGPKWQAWAVYDFAFIPARFGPAPFPQATGAAWWSMLTYGLLHANWTHVLLNSLWLVVFSKPVQAFMGNVRYLLILAIGIIAGALASLALHWGQDLILVGISGGVSALLAAAIPLMYGRGRPLRPIEIFTNRSALIFTLMWLALTVVSASTQYLSNGALSQDNAVAWEAHLGGFAAGLAAFYVLLAKPQSGPTPTLH